jgi:hypothetical protein
MRINRQVRESRANAARIPADCASRIITATPEIAELQSAPTRANRAPEDGIYPERGNHNVLIGLSQASPAKRDVPTIGTSCSLGSVGILNTAASTHSQNPM